MKTSDFDYDLPQELIAQRPLAQRDDSRLLVLHRATGEIEHRRFTDLVEYLDRGDILVANDSRVFPARLFGRKPTGGRVEILLLEQLDDRRWKALVGGKRIVEGTAIQLNAVDGTPSEWTARVTAVLDGPLREIEFDQPVDGVLDTLGHTPLPPYIHETLADAERYQTVYSRQVGSAAAPTAGLHFTGDLLFTLRDRGVLFETTTLHIGLDTFKPVEVDHVHDHRIHTEWARLTPEAAKRINEAKLAGGRLVAAPGTRRTSPVGPTWGWGVGSAGEPAAGSSPTSGAGSSTASGSSSSARLPQNWCSRSSSLDSGPISEARP